MQKCLILIKTNFIL